MSERYVIKKYMGDDAYSYAIFKAADVQHVGKRTVVFSEEATPVASGLSKMEAEAYKRRFEQK